MLFSVLTRIYLFGIDKVFYTYLSDFAWIILSKNFRKTLSSSSSTVPPVSRVQRYDFFIYLQLFSKLFFNIFELFSFRMISNALHNEKYSNLCNFITFFRLFSPFLLHFRSSPDGKISQKPEIRRKTERLQHGFFKATRQQVYKTTRQNLAETRRTQRMLVLWRHINPHPQLSTINHQLLTLNL